MLLKGANTRFEKVDQNKGSTLISALMTLLIMGVAVKTLMQLHASSTGSIKSTGIRLDLQDIRRTISSRLSCPKSLESFGSAPPINCSGDVVLRDRSGRNIISDDHKLANWIITARCENLGNKNGLSIYAAKKLSTGEYMKDPLNSRLVFDEKSPISLLLKPDVRPCASFFAPDAMTLKSCPNPDDFIAGVNFETGEIKCLPKLSTNDPNHYAKIVESSSESCGGNGPSGHIPAFA